MKKKFPYIRYLTSYETAIKIIENGFLKSKTELNIKTEDLDWNNDREKSELKLFGTTDLIFWTPDWFKEYNHETGHGPVMIYFKQKLFDDFKITFTVTDSKVGLISNYYEEEDFLQFYDSIINNEDGEIVNEIMNNYDIKNEAKYFNTSKGRQYLDSLYCRFYSEFQIHTNKIPISYISKIKFTETYLYKNDNDAEMKQKLIDLVKGN